MFATNFVRLVTTGHHSIWDPASQDKIAGGHAGVGVISLGGAPLSLPSFVTPQFQEFFRLGRVLRTTLPTAQGGVVHLFVVYGYQGAEEDAEKLRLIDRLLQAVLVEAQMVCIGQPMLIAGDLNADPAVILCLAKGIYAGRYVVLALAYSLGAGLTPDITCTFNRDYGTGSRRDFFVGCPGALAASQACFVTDRWFTLHFSVLARFRIDAWMSDVACPIACQPIWPACWLDTPDVLFLVRSSSTPAEACAGLVFLPSLRCVPFGCRQAQMLGIMASVTRRAGFSLHPLVSGSHLFAVLFGSTVDTCYVSLQRLLWVELFELSAMLGSTVALGDDFVAMVVFSAMRGSTVALGDDFLELVVLSAIAWFDSGSGR